MPEETVTTPPAADAAVQPTTPAPEAKAEQPQPKPAPDYEAAYKGLQTTVNKLHAREEDLLNQNRQIADALESVKKTQMAIARESLSEEKVKELESGQRIEQERSAALQAAHATEAFIVAQTGLFIDVLKVAGIDPNDPEIDWGRNAGNVQEWRNRVGPSIQNKLAKTIEEKTRRAESAVHAKSAQAIKEEAAALAQRQLKAADVDKVDTARGGPPTSLGQRIADMDPTSEDFRKLMIQAKAGKLHI
jgi:hypothetical protein